MMCARTRNPSRQLHDESGIALPMILMMLFAGLAVATVTVTASVNTQSGSVRDERTKGALAAADSGVNQALLRYNRIPIASGSTTPCIVNGPGGAAALQATLTTPTAQAGWCPAVTGSVGGSTYTYQVKPTLASNQLEVVSIGTTTGVTRRLDVTAKAVAGGTSPFASASVIGRDSISVGVNSSLTANVATNGHVGLGNGAALCGNAQIGTGQSISFGNNTDYGGPACGNVGGTTTYGTVTMPTVTLPGTNNNANMTASYTGGAPQWNAGTRTLVLNNGTTLNLAGFNYIFCSITLNTGSTINVASGARLYFDAPENCGPQGSGTPQLQINSNSYITGIIPANVAMLFVGSDSLSRRINVSSNVTLPANCNIGLVVIAPRTDFVLNSNAKYCGGVLAKTVTLSSNSQMYTDDLADDFVLGGGAASGFQVDKFVECSAAAQATPNTGC